MNPSASAARTIHLVTRPFVCRQCRLRSAQQARQSLNATAGQRYLATAQAGDDTSPIAEVNRTLSSRPPSKKAKLVRRKPVLPDGSARTRFAPSPTGYLHIGGLRTALFSYLLAKRTGGQFLLRIEDTDQKRLVPDAESKILQDLQWAGLEWDEGPGIGGPHGPYRQSERKDIYQTHAKQLFEQGSAYACFCTPQTSASHQAAAYVTSGCYQDCCSLSREEAARRVTVDGQPFTLRLNAPPDAHKRMYPDLVYGNIKRLKRSPAAPQPLASSDDGGSADPKGADTILMKSDGTPTYHFANVVDDHLMRITHVIRGAEWMASTPLHYDIYSAFGWQPPQFAHVSLLVDEKGAKLSKRNSELALDVASMRETLGVPASTLNNFLALLGWSNPTRNDLMDMSTLISNFDLKFTRGNAIVTMEKLKYLQKEHTRELRRLAHNKNDPTSLMEMITPIVREVKSLYPDSICNGELTTLEHPDALPDRLTAYCSDVFLSDMADPTESPQDFVQRHSYMFHWEPALVPQHEDVYYTKFRRFGFPVEVLRDLAKRFINDFVWEPAVDMKTLSNPTLGRNARDIRAVHLLGVCLSLRMGLDKCCFALSFSGYTNMDSPPLHDVDVGIFPLSDDEARKVFAPEKYTTSLVIDIGEIVSNIAAVHAARVDHSRYTVSQTDNTASFDASAVERAVKIRIDAVNQAMGQYLRRQIMCDKSGPPIHHIMAVLGESECRRRLYSS